MPDPQIQIPLRGGPDEGTDPRQLPPGSVISVRNAVYDADGTYQPRLGYTRLLGASANPSGCRALYTRGTELLVSDASNLWSWDSQSSNYVSRDVVQDWSVSHKPLQNASSSYQSWSEAVYQNYRVVAWVDTQDNLARTAVFDTNTGACVLGPSTITADTACFNVQVLLIGSTAIVLYTRRPSTTTHLVGYTVALNPLGTVPGSSTALDAGDTVFSPVYGACVVVGTTNFAVAYELVVSGSQSSWVLRTFNAALSQQVARSFQPTNGTNGFEAIAICANSGENLWLAAAANNTAYASKGLVTRFDPSTLVQSAGPFAVPQSASTTHSADFGGCSCCSVVRQSSTQCVAAFSVEATYAGVNLPNRSTQWAAFTTAGINGVTSGATQTLLATQLSIDPVTGNATGLLTNPAGSFKFVYRIMVSGSPSTSQVVYYQPNGTYALCGFPAGGAGVASADLQAMFAPQIAGLALPGLNPVTSSTMRSLPPLVPTSSGFETVTTIARTVGRTGIELVAMGRAGTAQRTAANVGQHLYFGGGYYDGQAIVENGYFAPPQPFLAADQSGAPTNSYQYVCTFARFSAQGDLEESAPSSPVYEVSSANANIKLTIDTLHVTRKQRWPRDSSLPGSSNPIFILVYRTQALESGDTTLYLQSVLPYPAANENTLTADQIVITDTTTDAVLSTQPTLYTMSSELGHDAPDTLHGVIAHFNRAWGIGSDNRSMWFGQAYSAGVMPSWSLNFILTLDETNEDIVALGDLVDKLLIFTKKRVYVLYGDGPSNANTGAEWELPPRRLPAASGCIDARSVVSTPLGVMYQSERGIEVVTPNLTVEFIGLAVSKTTAAFPVCSSAVLAGSSSTVRFTFTTSDVPASQVGGVLVVYDLRRQRWSTHYLTAGGQQGNTAGAPCYAGVSHPSLGYVEAHNLDQYGFSGVAVISRESVSTDAAPWADYGQFFVPLQVQLAWIKSGDLQGWQRVRRIRVLADFHDAHTLNMAVDYDYQVVGELHSRSSATIAALVSGSWEQVRFIPGRGKGEALSLTLATAAPTNPQVLGSGRGAGFVGVAFEIRPAKGGYRNLAAAAKG